MLQKLHKLNRECGGAEPLRKKVVRRFEIADAILLVDVELPPVETVVQTPEGGVETYWRLVINPSLGDFHLSSIRQRRAKARLANSINNMKIHYTILRLWARDAWSFARCSSVCEPELCFR